VPPPASDGDAVRVGIVLREEDIGEWAGRFTELAQLAVDAGVNHLTVGDHVSFADGHGADGLIQSAALLAAHPRIGVQTGVYLLALRHPAIVARQLSTIGLLAPGRFTFGIGVGGDDPKELELCGIDRRQRGARTTEALRIVRAFLTGKEVDFDGRFFALRGAIRPAPAEPIPILVGGRADATFARVGELGDGWLALWVSPRRYAEALGQIDAAAARAGRTDVHWRHALQLWAGMHADPEVAKDRLATTMKHAYGIPFERFERYCPCGPPETIAEALAPYLELGCRTFSFVAVAASLHDAMITVAEVKQLLSVRLS
jgi:alkanesulfonate monooxygenase SsuD/methylene tetrahydromethanopterin reductase-like flavin-dependent oxidoreductase (luciferase family)